jgi:cation diffusion facilitator family transporter
MSSSGHNSLKAVFFAMGGNTLIAIIKFIVAIITGSAALMAEAIHSTADCMNQIFLLIGNKRSAKPATEAHPFGYGKEEFFWGFMVAMLLFLVGALFSIYEGIHKLWAPEPLKHVFWSFAVLVTAILIEAKSFSVAYKELRKSDKRPLFTCIRESSDTNLIVILMEDLAALAGLMVVLISTLLAEFVHPLFDGAGSVVVGILLVYVSYILMTELRKLMVGESAPREIRNQIKEIVKTHKVIRHINRIQTMMMGNGNFLLLLSVDIDDSLPGYDIENYIEHLKSDIRKKFPEAKDIYIELKDAERNAGN